MGSRLMWSCSGISPQAGRLSPLRRWTAATPGGTRRADGSDTQSMLVQRICPVASAPWAMTSAGSASSAYRWAASAPCFWLPGPDARYLGGGGHESGSLGQLRRTNGTAPSTAPRTSPPTTYSRSGPSSQRRPNGSTAGPRTSWSPRSGTTSAGLPAPVEGGFQPGGHDAAYWRSVLPNVLSFLGWHLG